MKLDYIDKNLNEVIQNQDNVLYIRPYLVGNKRALYAIVKEDEGIYKKVQITEKQYKSLFPFEPMYWFYNGPGYFYLKNCIVIDNWLALNINNLDGFKYKALNNNPKDIGIFATFNDGTSTFIERKSKKRFEKEKGLESYIEVLKKFKEYSPQHETYEIIECYSENNNNSDTFVIPKLQKKEEEQSNVRKLAKSDCLS